jgi:hypothetical protein
MPFNKEHKYRLIRYVTFLEKEIVISALISSQFSPQWNPAIATGPISPVI